MDLYDVKRLALVLSVQAKIEAMKTDNSQRPNDQRYCEDYFFNCSHELKDLAYKHNDQL